jgi:hypothetical protein
MIIGFIASSRVLLRLGDFLPPNFLQIISITLYPRSNVIVFEASGSFFAEWYLDSCPVLNSGQSIKKIILDIL